jgi:hypothetical protein
MHERREDADRRSASAEELAVDVAATEASVPGHLRERSPPGPDGPYNSREGIPGSRRVKAE